MSCSPRGHDAHSWYMVPIAGASCCAALLHAWEPLFGAEHGAPDLAPLPDRRARLAKRYVLDGDTPAATEVTPTTITPGAGSTVEAAADAASGSAHSPLVLGDSSGDRDPSHRLVDVVEDEEKVRSTAPFPVLSAVVVALQAIASSLRRSLRAPPTTTACRKCPERRELDPVRRPWALRPSP